MIRIGRGGSPRASIGLFRCAQALAAIHGRDFIIPDDVKRMAQPVLGHRLILRPESRLRKKTAAAVVTEIVGDARHVESGDRVAATGDRDEPSCLGGGRDGSGDRKCPLAERRDLESADRAVPQERRRGSNLVDERRH